MVRSQGRGRVLGQSLIVLGTLAAGACSRRGFAPMWVYPPSTGRAFRGVI